MFRRRAKLGLSRKIVACYLFFCLIAVTWLAAGAVVTSHIVVDGRTADFCLTRLGSAGPKLEIHFQRHGAEGLGPLLADLQRECRAQWCGVVGPDGKFVAHTAAERIGTAAAEVAGDRAQWGAAARVAYRDDQNRPFQEYRTPLAIAGRPIGELRIAIEQLSLWSSLEATARVAPMAVLAPLALVGVGAWLLRRQVTPVSEVDCRLQDLARQPVDEPCRLAPLRARDATSLGWNRLADRLEELERLTLQTEGPLALGLAAAERSDGRFEDVLQRLCDGVAVTDSAGRIEFANHAVSALLGDTDETSALAGALLDERLMETAGGSAPSLTELQSPAAKRRTAVCEVVQQGGGAERVLRVSRTPLGGDTARRFVWSLRDVTQQRLAEQTRDRFIDTATHELRTPLTNIKAYAETLATSDYIDVELQKEFCNIINSEVTRLARFIDDLLSISSMEVGALTIDRQKVETERLFTEALAKVEPQMQKKAIDFQVALPPKLPELHLDKDKIVAVIVNVVGNAAKYTPAGGRVSLKVKADEAHLRIAVEDTGVGIAADELPKVFDKFFRSDDPRVQAEVGSGLGLSLAREVVRMHGGELTVESELNQGSTFTIVLPLI